MTRSKPTIVLVPGAWHTPDAFDPLLPILHAAGYPTTALSLPSVGVSPGLPDATADIAAVRDLVEGLADLGRDVIVVSHSYGAMPATDGIHGISKVDREANGRPGGVVGLVYIAAVVPLKGNGLVDAMKNNSPEEEEAPRVASYVYHENGTSTVANPEETFYGDLSPEVARFHSRLLRTHSSGTFLTPISNETYRKIPSAYLMCTEDKAIPLVIQQRLAREAGITLTETIHASHSPFLSQPETVVNFIRQVAGEKL